MKLGEILFDRWDDPVAIMVYSGETGLALHKVNSQKLHENNFSYDPEELEAHFEEYPDTNWYLTEYGDLEELDDIEYAMSESTKELAAGRYKKVVKALKHIEGLDLESLIISDGAVYSGDNECASFIQGTYTWCSSSMEC